MPANFTRRFDLFLDAGLPDPSGTIAQLTRQVEELGLSTPPHTGPGEAGLTELRPLLAPRLREVKADQLRLARLVPEWMAARGGDLASAIWLARAEYGEGLDLVGYLLAVLDQLIAQGRHRDSLAYARFMLDLSFDWTDIYADPHLAYGFLQEREPNPLVWRLLEELSGRPEALRILELGCGIGNDAFGFFVSSRLERYQGVDVSGEALERFRARARQAPPRVEPGLVEGDFRQALAGMLPWESPFNVVYSYSSLHYFSSGELKEIYALVRRALSNARPGYFCFGIKGAGSIWDGQGLPLYRPDVWVNWDGQSRWFPSRSALARQLDEAGFEIRFHELHEHWGYSELGKRDVFHYVLCSPRAVAQDVGDFSI